MHKSIHLSSVMSRLLAVVAVVLPLLIVGSGSAGGSLRYEAGAEFSEPLLKVAIVGGGHVTSRPRGISCPTRCQARFASGTGILLTARARRGWEFARFSRPCGVIPVCLVTLRRLTVVRAIFRPSLPPAGAIVARIAVPDAPHGLIYSDGAIWVARHHAGQVARVDPDTNTVVAQVPIPSGQPARFAAGAEGLWHIPYSSDTIQLIDPATNRVDAEVSTPGENCCVVAVGAGSIWVQKDPETPGGHLDRVDAGSLKLVAHVPMQFGAQFAFGSVWGSAGQDVVRVDPATNAVVARIAVGQGCCTFMSAGAGALWVVTQTRVIRIDPVTNTVTARVPVPGSPEFVAAEDDAVWVVGGSGVYVTENLWRIDPTANRVVAGLAIGPQTIGGITLGAGSVWISVFSNDQVLRIRPLAPTHR